LRDYLIAGFDKDEEIKVIEIIDNSKEHNEEHEEVDITTEESLKASTSTSAGDVIDEDLSCCSGALV